MINNVEYAGNFVDGNISIGKISYADYMYFGEISNFQPNGYGQKSKYNNHTSDKFISFGENFDSGYYENGVLVRSIELPSSNSGSLNNNNSSNSGGASFDINGNTGSNQRPCSGCNGSKVEDCMFCGGDGETEKWVAGGGADSPFSSYIEGDCDYCIGGDMECRTCGGRGYFL